MTELGNHEAQNTLRYFLSYFDDFRGDMRGLAGFEEKDDVAATEEETAQFFTLTNWDLKFEIIVPLG
jgi:hypothetical protein